MAKRLSIQVKFFFQFFLVLLLLLGAFFASLVTLRTEVSRNEAAAVADHVVAFRTWVAGSGMIWVNKLSHEFPDFLMQHADGAGGEFFGKNPALATRELSTIASISTSRATFRVTSDEYRHQGNEPDAFEVAAIRSLKQNQKQPFIEGYEGRHYRYARPILVEQGCLKCHGDPNDAPAAVLEKYGAQKAFGYQIGQVRGIISVKLPALGVRDVGRAMFNVYSIFFILLAVILNLFFSYQFIIRRMVMLTKDAEAIAKGKLTTEIKYTDPLRSNDELDHLAHAVNLLKRSLVIAMRMIKSKK